MPRYRLKLGDRDPVEVHSDRPLDVGDEEEVDGRWWRLAARIDDDETSPGFVCEGALPVTLIFHPSARGIAYQAELYRPHLDDIRDEAARLHLQWSPEAEALIAAIDSILEGGAERIDLDESALGELSAVVRVLRVTAGKLDTELDNLRIQLHRYFDDAERVRTGRH